MDLSSTDRLNNGVRIPVLGLGVYQVDSGSETEQAVSAALQAGYRLIDTARYYANEKDAGKALPRTLAPTRDGGRRSHARVPPELNK